MHTQYLDKFVIDFERLYTDHLVLDLDADRRVLFLLAGRGATLLVGVEGDWMPKTGSTGLTMSNCGAKLATTNYGFLWVKAKPGFRS